MVLLLLLLWYCCCCCCCCHRRRHCRRYWCWCCCWFDGDSIRTIVSDDRYQSVSVDLTSKVSNQTTKPLYHFHFLSYCCIIFRMGDLPAWSSHCLSLMFYFCYFLSILLHYRRWRRRYLVAAASFFNVWLIKPTRGHACCCILDSNGMIGRWATLAAASCLELVVRTDPSRALIVWNDGIPLCCCCYCFIDGRAHSYTHFRTLGHAATLAAAFFWTRRIS